jgi:EpsI family protein
MPKTESRWSFLSNPAALVLSILLIGQAIALYGSSRREIVPAKPPLSGLAPDIQSWHMIQETELDKETLDVLKADETLSRVYVDASMPLQVQLFVAYFKTQRTGQTPHSPRNCLPGSGWLPTASGIILIPIEGRDPIEVNRYLVEKGDAKYVVLYWYQSRDRTVASEYKAKVYSVLDAIRYNRTDTALVRVFVPVAAGERESTETAIQFIQALYPALRQRFPA